MTNEEAINWIINLSADIGKTEHQDLWHYEQALDEIKEILESLSSLQLEQKIGKWIDMGDFEKCSVCKTAHLKELQTYYGKATWLKSRYCPNCGAKMK